MNYDISDVARIGNRCRALAGFDVDGVLHICACDSESAVIYTPNSDNTLQISFLSAPERNEGIDFAGLYAPSNKFNPAFSDLENILLINHRTLGFFGFSLYELIVDGDIRIDNNDKRKFKSHHLRRNVSNERYIIKDNRIFFAGITEGKISFGEVLVGYSLDVSDGNQISILPYHNLTCHNHYVTEFLLPEDDVHNGGFSREKRVTSIEVDVDGDILYVGTDSGAIYRCGLSTSEKDASFFSIYQIGEDYDDKVISNLHLVVDNIGNGETRDVLMFNRKSVVDGYIGAPIEVLGLQELNEGSSNDTNYLYKDMRVNWFRFDGIYLHTVYGRELMIRDVEQDRVSQDTAVYNLYYSDRHKISAARFVGRKFKNFLGVNLGLIFNTI
ncbi:MAG: hypothetical protein ABIG89_03675 [Candidatus Woesearchaeota archaeon]